MVYQLVAGSMSLALQFTSEVFANKEPTTVALGITSAEFEHVFRDVMKKSVLSGFSYADETLGKVSTILSIPYDEFLEVEYNVLKEIEPMLALFDALKYEPRGKCLYVFSLASDGSGMATRVVQHTILEARKRGFKTIVADCTNVKSQKLLGKHGFVTKSEVFYDEFQHDGRYPFKNVKGTPSVQRMELML
jgi:predicted GNAT family acetyltransferase